MKANEIQVGDYVWLADGDAYEIKVESISMHKIGYHLVPNCKMHYSRLCKISPTRVTEGILEDWLSFGCNQIGGTPAWEYNIDNKYYLTIDNYSNTVGKDWYIHIDNEDRQSIMSADFQYLHQLQQIVRLATNKELEVRL